MANVKRVRVNRDQGLRRLTLYLTDFQGVELPAVSLSDGTLRFIALAVMELDNQENGVICLEEPENGIHPERVGSMLQLLRDIAMDPSLPCDENNPLRQVLLSTHSPTVVEQLDAGDTVFVDTTPGGMVLRAMGESWRTRSGDMASIPLGRVVNYLRPGRRTQNEASLGRQVSEKHEQMKLPLEF
jgi:predicted ATPase